MAAGQWTVPVILGLLAAGLTFVAAPEEIEIRRDGHAKLRIDGPYVLVPSVDHDASLLRYGANDTRHGLGGMLDIHAGRIADGVFWWDGNGWGCHRPGASCTTREQPVSIALWQAPQTQTADPTVADTAPVADASHTAPGAASTASVTAADATVELTFYMFTSSGHLLATNDPRSAWERFDLHGQFTQFSSTTWHLGDGPAPAGARTLPMFREHALALLVGTPVGGVQSAVLEEHPYEWLLGPVWATARVEAIVPSGPVR